MESHATNDTVTAVILAAGAGTRLGALAARYSKPMVPLAGRPLIDHVITRLSASGVGRLVVVAHVDDTGLADFLAARDRLITVVTQSVRRGIADALRIALPFLAEADGYLACACDSLFETQDISALIETGRRNSGAAVVALEDRGPEATISRSAARVEGDRVLAVVEKPVAESAPSGLVVAPLYWLPAACTPYLEAAIPPSGEGYISTALNHFIQSGGHVCAFRINGRIEITTAADVVEAEALLRMNAEG